MEKAKDMTCQQVLTAFFEKHPNYYLQAESCCTLKYLLEFNVSMSGKPGGWAAGIIYAMVNRCKRACGIPGLLNKECEEFFGVSMSTIHKRAWTIRRMLSESASSIAY